MVGNLTKQKLIKALAEVSGFDFEKEFFSSAGSFEEAVSLFLEQQISYLNSVNHIYRLKVTADVTEIRSKKEVEEEIKVFLSSVYDDIFVNAVNQYIEIANHYKEPKTSEKLKILKETMRKYNEKLNKELIGINTTASRYLKLSQEYGVFEKEYNMKLTFLTTVNTTKFYNILKNGDINLILP